MRPLYALFRFVPDLWRNRTLLVQFTLRNIELRHRGSYLGFIWSILNPLLMLALYVFVFGYIFRGRLNPAHPESRMNYAFGIFLGLILFHLVAEVLSVAPSVIVSNPNFVKKVVFPLEVLPAANVGASIFHATISLVLALLGIALLGPGLSVHMLWLPAILFPILFLLLGIAWFVSAIGVFFRDIGQVMGVLSMILLYASCVLFPSTSLPPAVWMVLRFNPLLIAVDLARGTVMWHLPVNFIHLAYLYAVSIGFCLVSYWFFRKTAPAFADVL